MMRTPMRSSPSAKEDLREGLVRAEVGLKLIADGYANPVALACPNDGSGRLFVVDQIGKVFVIGRDEVSSPRPFLDITDKIVDLDPGYDERGLLGMVFHPEYAINGRFFLFYSAPLREGGPKGWNCTNRLVEMRVSADDPQRADQGHMRVLLEIDKPQMNHNGGHIAFGPDGFLYVPSGDGGGENDRGEGHTEVIGNAQDLDSLLGKILRIDVDTRSDGREYGIPGDNPFVNGEGRPEIFAYGLRNPYHIAFDREGDGELFTGDAGQIRWEEVDIIVKGGNYGWNIKEGSHCFNPEDNQHDFLGCVDHGYRGEKLIDPIIDYRNLSNRSGGIGSVVIGGYVYRGKAIPYLRGCYIFGDFSGKHGSADGRIFVGSPPTDSSGRWTMDELEIKGPGKLREYLLSFGQDDEGELYVLTSDSEGPEGTSGRISRIIPPER